MKTPSISEKTVGPFVEKIEKLSRVQRLLIYAGTFLLLIGGFVWLFYLPKSGEIEKLSDELAKKKSELATARKNAREIEKVRAQWKEAQARFELAKTKLPEKEEIPSLLTGITAGGRDVGLDFLLFEPRSETQKDFYVEIPVAISVVGTYHNVGYFFDRVATLSRIVNIKDVKMAPGSDKDSGKLSTTCTAVTYKFKEAAPEPGKPNKKKRRK